jgi:hypothetical protein
MILGYATKDGEVQSSPEIIALTIPPQNYQFTKISGNFQEILPIEWSKIYNIPKEEVNRNYGFDMEMYSEDYESCTVAVSVNC